MSSHCRSCGAEIVWSTTTDGRPIPLDPPLIRIAVATGRVIESDRGVSAEVEIKSGRVSHFATCPQASQHRKNTPRRQVGVNGTPGEPAPGES